MNIYGLQKLTLLDYPAHTACIVFTGGCNFHCPFCYNASLVEKTAERLDEEDVFGYISERRKLLDGVSISGGEPTLNCDLKAFIKRIKELGLDVKLDTNGSNPTLLSELINESLVDYVAMDIKNSPEKYNATVGTVIDLSKIERSAELIMQSGIEYEFRTTVSEELHAEKDFEGIGKWLHGAKNYFIQAVNDTGELLSDYSFTPPSEERMKSFAEILRSFDINAKVRNL